MANQPESENWARRWDARYATASQGLFGEEPCVWLRAGFARPGFAPRSALALADGDGRNGTWLATRGLDVAAVDLSAEATRRAAERDRRAGVAVERVAADIETWEPPFGRAWELVAVLFLQGPESLRRRALKLGRSVLAPGGWLLLEGFGRPGTGGDGPGPDDDAKRWDIGETLAALDGLRIVEAFEGVAELDEGPRHRGPARLLRVLARRPD